MKFTPFPNAPSSSSSAPPFPAPFSLCLLTPPRELSVHRKTMGKTVKKAGVGGAAGDAAKKMGRRAPTVHSSDTSIIGAWDATKLRQPELHALEKDGFLERESGDHLLPGAETTPAPPAGFGVMFVAFLLCGLSFHVHEFLWGLLFVYGMQLHDLTPNMILHIARFVTLCECFLGVEPHWAL